MLLYMGVMDLPKVRDNFPALPGHCIDQQLHSTQTHACAHTYAHIHTHIHARTHIHANIQIYTEHIHTHSLTHTYKHTDIHMHTCMHVHTHTYTHGHTHMHLYTHRYVHARTFACAHTYTSKHERMHAHTHIQALTCTYKRTHIPLKCVKQWYFELKHGVYDCFTHISHNFIRKKHKLHLPIHLWINARSIRILNVWVNRLRVRRVMVSLFPGVIKDDSSLVKSFFAVSVFLLYFALSNSLTCRTPYLPLQIRPSRSPRKPLWFADGKHAITVLRHILS